MLIRGPFHHASSMEMVVALILRIEEAGARHRVYSASDIKLPN